MEKFRPNHQPEDYIHFTVDLTGCKHEFDIHDRFAAACDFPDFYGRNWDALYDCLTGIMEIPAFIHVTGVGKSHQDAQSAMTMVEEILRDAKERYEDIDYSIEW